MNESRPAGDPATGYRSAPAGAIGAVSAVLVAAVLATVVSALPVELRARTTPLPDLAAIDDHEERKQRFIEFLEPVVASANASVAQERERLLHIAQRHAATGNVRLTDAWWLERMRARYGVDADAEPHEVLAALHRRIDTVPASLALAQAAIESGWGTSRFAREGNNLFGQWCYRQGCGLVPAARPAGASHEVTVFRTVEESVRSYLDNLNAHAAYVPLRDLRAQARLEDREPSGVELAAGLVRYSERGEPYVREVRTVIRANDLDDREAS